MLLHHFDTQQYNKKSNNIPSHERDETKKGGRTLTHTKKKVDTGIYV